MAFLVACGGRSAAVSPTESPPARGGDPRSIQERTLEALWTVIDEQYLYPDRLNASWSQAYDQARRSLHPELDAQEFSEIVMAMMQALPEEAAVWQPRSDRIDQETSAGLEFEGIGAFFAYRDEPEPHIVLLAVIIGSPAEAAGLEAHESIYAIDGKPVTSQEGLDVVDRIRGPVDSQVSLTVHAPDDSIREVSVQRKRVMATTRLLVGRQADAGLGYMLFPPAPYAQLEQDVVAGVQILTDGGERPLEGLILDFRVASSGPGWPLETLMKLFITGEVGELHTRGGRETVTIEGEDVAGSQAVPLVVLVGPDTRGSPEFLAAAMQSVDRALVLGLPTHGLVERIEEFPLPDGSRVFVTTGTFFTLEGRDLGTAGVEPDQVIDADWDQVVGDRDPLIFAAAGYLHAQTN
jgi:carboxyl-terminal processing protease